MDRPSEKPATDAAPGDTSLEEVDAELVTRSLAGDPAAFGELVRRYEGRVFALASAALGGPARRSDVEDCAQETFLAAYRGLAGLREPAAFGGWLLGIARLQARQALKQRRRRAAAPLDGDAEAPRAEAEAGEALLRALSRLPEPEREAVALRHLSGRSPEEIAAVLGVPGGTVRSRISRGLERLRGMLT